MNVLGLCAGIGGLELGLHLAEPSSRPVVFVESDAFGQSVLKSRWPAAAIWDNVLTFDGRPWARRIQVLTAGFPCQPFSVAGKRRGTEDERWIWPEIAEIIRQVGPPIVFLENVPALITGGGLTCVLGSLADLGYAAEWGVFSCESLGASHRRKRVFILAHSQSLQCGQGREPQAERPGGPVRLGQGLADSLREQLGGQQVGGAQCPVPAEPPQHQEAMATRITLGDLAHSNGSYGRALRERKPKVGRRGKGLADRDREGLEIREEQHHQQLPAALGSGREIWAPGPGADWGSIRREWWPAEQSLCGVADGLPRKLEPDRQSRLRALGNAVSPPVAAVAWRVLTSRLTV